MWSDVEGRQESFGEFLKRERELRNITLDEISNATKIKKFYLDAIERDEYALLPGVAYLKGFVRVYAKYIGIDPDDTILRLESFLKEFDSKKTPVPIKQKYAIQSPNLYIAFVVVIIIFAIIVTIMRSREGEVKIGDQIRKEETIFGVNEREKVKEKEKSSTTVKEHGEGKVQKSIRINIRAKEKTWVMLKRDDEKPFDVILWEGNVVDWFAERKISLRIGNAQGVEIIYNGIPLKNLGSKGEVVDIVLPDDLHKFQ